MTKRYAKFFLGLFAIWSLVPGALAADRYQNGPRLPAFLLSLQVPEGGSTAIYLLGTSIACLGAMVVRARSRKPSQP